ncbi:electron transfer flavoprotein subunit beta/FixA family protein [Leucobacter rhizosphaerae]|uniref:Electron transfer flavoprotein subunit beta n=1 Tax=Leucobacter rhizosphaerae TaxID=2932245 RepID=A0ABY4FTR3_9MICO|nr:electron transfer flavoprotein subunit beta/FixA family protein [Leucobacter rhizosphaerae]UOQ59655.1 electron transfer flavoprotein subunit beta/FixA family protein [Leucobacter rhizosphaerae]
MKIVVLVKEVPDTYAERKLNLETGLADRGASDAVIDEICERALEVALSHADTAEGVEIVVLSVAPEGAATNLRKLLAMGAGSAVQVVSEDLLGADLGLTAETIAAVLRAEGFDLVIAGNQSTDGAAGMLASMLAELLEVPVITNLESVAIAADRVTGTRVSDTARTAVAATLPAIISITEQLPDARFPNFKGIMAAKKKPLTVLSLMDLGIDATDMTPARTIMTAISERPPRAAGVTLADGDGVVEQLAAYLAENRLV